MEIGDHLNYRRVWDSKWPWNHCHHMNPRQLFCIDERFMQIYHSRITKKIVDAWQLSMFNVLVVNHFHKWTPHGSRFKWTLISPMGWPCHYCTTWHMALGWLDTSFIIPFTWSPNIVSITSPKCMSWFCSNMHVSKYLGELTKFQCLSSLVFQYNSNVFMLKYQIVTMSHNQGRCSLCIINVLVFVPKRMSRVRVDFDVPHVREREYHGNIEFYSRLALHCYIRVQNFHYLPQEYVDSN